MMEKLNTFLKENKFPIQIFLANKALLIAISIIVILLFPVGNGFEINTENTFINHWSQWDGKAYLIIAENGYEQLPDGRSLLNFLPFYPSLIRIFSFFGYGLSAFLISNICTFIAVVFLYKLVLREYGDRISRRTLFFLLFFPTTFFLTAVYTESLFLALAIASFYYARTGKWKLAGILSIALPLTRIIGFAFFLPLLVEYYHQRNFDIKKTGKDFIFVLFPLIGVAIFFFTYAFISGNMFSYFEQGNLWNRNFQLPHQAFIKTAHEFTIQSSIILKGYFVWSAALVIAALIILFVSIKKIRYSYTVYSAIVVIIPLFSGTLEAFSRFLLVAFPLFITIALISENRKLKFLIYSIYVLFFFLVIFLTARFVIGAVG